MVRKPKEGKSLADIKPELAKQWHSTKNVELTPYDVSVKSGKKVWWKCDKGSDHEWESSIANRTKGSGCSVCSGHKVVKSNCLATLNPEIAKQWHSTKNLELTPYDVSVKSGKKVWWKCDKGDDHEWQTSVSHRSSGRKCPVCSGYKVVKSNSLATLNPDLAKQWHPTKNLELTPYDVSVKSDKKVWWKCPKGSDHEWESSIANRSNGSNCPVCLGKKVVKSNCFATLHPEIAKQWHPTKNGDLTPYDFVAASNKRVWWKCDKGDDHEWHVPLWYRSDGSGCPMCHGDIIVKSNCLATLNPDLAKQWHPTKNGELTPYDVSIKSSKMIWWKCEKGDDHEWESTPNTRSYGTGCGVCSAKKIVKSNCLVTLHPEIAKQWHPTKNGELTPNDVGLGSRKEVWWKCDKVDDHEWISRISSRNVSGCPSCAEYGFNRSEDALFYLRKINLENGKQALKFGITNNMDGDREKQQKRHVEGSVKTILREKVSGEIALDIERLCKRYFGRKGYLTVQEFPDGFSETIRYSKENLKKIKSIVDEVLSEKAEKKS